MATTSRRAASGSADTRPAAPRSGPRPDAAEVLAAQGGSRLRRLLKWLPGADDAALTGMADELVKGDGESLSIRLLMARWAEVNPQALLAWAERQRGRDAEYIRNNAIEALARVDFERAWAACAQRPGARTSALLGLTAVDPAKCLRLLRSDPSLLHLENHMISKVLGRIARQDPAGAASLLGNVPAARLSNLASGVATAWMRQDPAAAIAWLGTLPVSARGVVAREAGEWLARNAPEQLPALLDNLPAGNVRTGIAAAAFEQLARKDAAAAQAQLEIMPDGPARQYCRALLLHQLLRAGDEAPAIVIAAQLGWHVSSFSAPDVWQVTSESSSGGMNGIRSDLAGAPRILLDRIAARDPKQAAELLLAYDGNNSNQLAAAAAGHDPAAMATALAAAFMEHKDHSRVGFLLMGVVSAWAANDPSAAAAWIDTAAPPHYLKDFESALYPMWAWSDPDAMIRWAATRSNESNSAAWTSLAQAQPNYAARHAEEFFAASPPPETVASLLGNLAPAQQQEVLRKMPDTMSAGDSPAMTTWLNAKPDEASAWVRELPPGERRNSVTAPLVNWALSAGDCEAAVEWSLTAPAVQRAPLLKTSLSAWARTDPDAAANAIRAAGLPPEETAQWLEFLKSPPKP